VSWLILAVLSASYQHLLAQAGVRPPASKSGMTIVPAEITCPAELGVGVKTKLRFCDVLTGRDVTQGIIVKIPPHVGPASLLFSLHNRHTYSEEQVKARQAFANYTATIGVLTLDNVLLRRVVVQSEFRTAADIVDWVGGGAGPGGVKAVAPTGSEQIVVEVPDKVTELSVLGERLDILRIGGLESYVAPGRPIATISNVRVEYRPGRAVPAKR
jgi:hypothetical protein